MNKEFLPADTAMEQTCKLTYYTIGQHNGANYRLMDDGRWKYIGRQFIESLPDENGIVERTYL